MNKYLQSFVESRKLKKSETRGFVYYGVENGYEMNFLFIPGNPVSYKTVLYFHTEDQHGPLEIFLRDNKKVLKIVRYNVNQDFAIIEWAPFLGAKKAFANIEVGLPIVTQKLQELAFRGAEYCSICGKEHDETKRLTTLDGLTFYVHESCYQELQEGVKQKNESFDAQPNNYVKGLGGAFLGALAGCIVWFIIFLLGYFAAIAGILVTFLASLLYDKFGGKPDKIKMVIVCSVSLIMILLTTFGIHLVVAQGLYESLTMLEAFQKAMVEYTFEDGGKFSTEFAYNMGLALLFGGLGVGAYFVNMRRATQKNKSTIQ